MRRLIPVLIAGLAVVPMPSAHAAPAGCEVLTFGATNGGCSYTSTGPGTYEVESPTGFRIMVSSNGGTSWSTLVANPAPTAQSGDLATTAGQLVQVAVGVREIIVPPAAPYRYQVGHIKAGDK